MAGRQAKILGKADFERVLKELTYYGDPHRALTMVLLSMRAGLRAAEIAKLEWPMVLDANGKIADVMNLEDRIAKKKSGRQIPIHRDLRAALQNLLRYLTRLDSSVGDRAFAALDNTYIFKIRDKLRHTPIAANHTIAVLRTLFRFAIARRLVSIDPTAGIGKLKGGDGYLRWSLADIEAFRLITGPMMLLAMELGLYTGQRLSDVIQLAWSDYDGHRIRLQQQKTGTSLSIPVHPDLQAILDTTPRLGTTILTTKTGLAFHPRVFSHDFREARIQAGLSEGLSFHGLRHTAAARLAELGAGAPEIQAITGHKSLKLVEHYIRQASQELQADRAISRLPRRKSAKPDC